MVKNRKLPPELEKYGYEIEQIFVGAAPLKAKYGKDFAKIPAGAIGLYTYYERLSLGLKQLMAGERKFALKHISKDDLIARTPEAAEISGIPYVMDVDKKEVDDTVFIFLLTYFL